MLSAEQRRSWDENGYLVLPGFYTPDELRPTQRLVERVWAAPPAYLVTDGTRGGGRRRLIDVPPAERNDRFLKLNDLYLECPEVRALALADRLVPVLNDLMTEPVVLCNSLNFEKGSQQPEHIDSLYMTPRTPGRLVATWVALEDATPEAGQLFYYPGSHRLPLYRFADGTHHARPDEGAAWLAYIRDRIARAGLRREQFAARAGDLFIWHANLVHGGSAITDPARTRKSLVCHYYGLSDSRVLGFDCVPAGTAYWCRRPHPPLPTPPRGGLRHLVGRLLRGIGLRAAVRRLVRLSGSPVRGGG